MGIGYDAKEYSKSKELDFREAVEWHTIESLVMNGGGLNFPVRVLDAGCGDGVYARRLVDSGLASRVTGVDCDESFINLAVEKSKGYDNINYVRSAIQDFKGGAKFDLALGSYILSYPKNDGEVRSYCNAIMSSLKLGGVFIGFNNNPFQRVVGQDYSKYGFTKEVVESKVFYRVKNMTSPIINYLTDPEIVERAFLDAGAQSFNWIKPFLNSSESREDYWREFFGDGEKFSSPFIAMLARK